MTGVPGCTETFPSSARHPTRGRRATTSRGVVPLPGGATERGDRLPRSERQRMPTLWSLLARRTPSRASGVTPLDPDTGYFVKNARTGLRPDGHAIGDTVNVCSSARVDEDPHSRRMRMRPSAFSPAEKSCTGWNRFLAPTGAVFYRTSRGWSLARGAVWCGLVGSGLVMRAPAPTSSADRPKNRGSHKPCRHTSVARRTAQEPYSARGRRRSRPVCGAPFGPDW